MNRTVALDNDASQSAAQRPVVRKGARHLRPKRGAVIKLAKVAELVDNNVVAELCGQKGDLVIKI